MPNDLKSKNKYGKLDINQLEKFESELGNSLPVEYRKYLIESNGGDFEKSIVKLPDEEGDTNVHHMFGIHTGPEYRQLTHNYNYSRNILSDDYLPICDDATGNWFFIKIKGENCGAIYFVDHEELDREESEQNLIFVANNFNEFVASMKSDDEMMSDFKKTDPEGFDEFEKLLEEMKRLRKQEIDNNKP